MQKVIPVRALVWLTVEEDGDVSEAEFVADTSWMTLDPEMEPFTVVNGESAEDLSWQQAQDVLLDLVDSRRWYHTNLKLEL
jgi:hypothetical protein